MPYQKTRQLIDQRLKNICGENYLFGLHWHGHPQIPSNLQNGTSIYWAILSSADDLFADQPKIVADKTLQESHTQLVCSTSETFFDYIRSFPITLDQFEKYVWFSDPHSFDFHLSKADKTQMCRGMFAKQLLRASQEYLSQNYSSILLHTLAQGSELSEETDPEILFKKFFTSFPVEEAPEETEVGAPPIPFSEPIAIYQHLDTAILVSADPLAVIKSFDQHQHQDWMERQSISSVQVATPQQLVSAVETTDMLGFRLLSYEHIWGKPILESVTLDLETLLLNAAQSITNLSIWQAGKSIFDFQAYKVTNHNHFSKLIHDLQNRVLNIQLQNELLSRFKLTPKGNPDIIIPGRESDPADRLKAICVTLSWWSGFYLNLLDDMRK
ncbi:MAG: hypothetical protein AAGD96_06435 [Chloroflexota bacterium]